MNRRTLLLHVGPGCAGAVVLWAVCAIPEAGAMWRARCELEEIERPITVRVSSTDPLVPIVVRHEPKGWTRVFPSGGPSATVPLDASGHGAGVLRVPGRRVTVTQRINGATQPGPAASEHVRLDLPDGWVCSPESAEVTPGATEIDFRVVKAQ